MVLNIKTTEDIDEAAHFIDREIVKQLKEGKKVLFFVTGGSSIAVAVRTSHFLREHENLLHNLTVMLSDERYGPVDHKDSNWRELIEQGFHLPNAKLIPTLFLDDRDNVTKKFNERLQEQFQNNDYKIGMFGVGIDGHTAGILPDTIAVNSPDLAIGYDTHAFSRITITPKAIGKLDEAVVWAQDKDNVIKTLSEDIDINKQPAQILKMIPVLTIFTNYKKI